LLDGSSGVAFYVCGDFMTSVEAKPASSSADAAMRCRQPFIESGDQAEPRFSLDNQIAI